MDYPLCGMRVKHENNTVFIALPAELRRPIEGGCQCVWCRRHPALTPSWDTLAVGRTDGGYAWTVHYPEFSCV